jgi:hypothetical protein
MKLLTKHMAAYIQWYTNWTNNDWPMYQIMSG